MIRTEAKIEAFKHLIHSNSFILIYVDTAFQSVVNLCLKITGKYNTIYLFSILTFEVIQFINAVS